MDKSSWSASAGDISSSKDDSQHIGPEEKWDGKAWRSGPNWTDDTWAPPESVKVTKIGVAVKGVDGVVCASFNAG